MEQMVAQCTQMMNGMMGGSGMMGGMMGGNGMMGMMAWGTLLVVALLIMGIVLLMRRLSARGRNRTGGALAILQERFARGEIGIEEYQERRSILLDQA